jgi:2-polyprenyl-3-methyl-5-hydroxy-6-metoxy-1,4-benzoquinol methylase
MSEKKDYLKVNKELWNKKLEFHLKSKMYDMESFRAGRNSLDDIVMDEIGPVRDKTILHLQCHFGQDTMSFARLGAKATGLDLSDKCIESAESINKELGLDAKFICGNVLDTRKLTDELYDIVFTSYGTIVWLPDLDLWAKQVVDSMKPGGLFYMAEFHPVIQMFDYPKEDIAFPYFNTGAFEETLEGTYADPTADMKAQEIFWLHGIAEVITALRNHGLTLEFFHEHDYSPYDCFGNSKEVEPGKYVFGSFPYRLPHVYSMRWIKEK